MKELLQWMVFAGVGVVLFLYGLMSARRERKSTSHPASPASPEYNQPGLRSATYRSSRHK